VNESEYTPPQTSDQSLERFASRIRVYSPPTTLQRVAADYMREWLCWQPGVLFRYGSLSLLAGEREVYLGGLTVAKTCSFSCPKACTNNAAVLCSSRSRANLFKPKTKPSSARIVIWPKPNKTALRIAIWPTILHGMLRQELGRSAIGRRCSPTERWCRLLIGAGEEARRFWMPISSSYLPSTRARSPTRLPSSTV